jgi:hypothetical protein
MLRFPSRRRLCGDQRAAATRVLSSSLSSSSSSSLPHLCSSGLLRVVSPAPTPRRFSAGSASSIGGRPPTTACRSHHCGEARPASLYAPDPLSQTSLRGSEGGSDTRSLLLVVFVLFTSPLLQRAPARRQSRADTPALFPPVRGAASVSVRRRRRVALTTAVRLAQHPCMLLVPSRRRLCGDQRAGATRDLSSSSSSSFSSSPHLCCSGLLRVVSPAPTPRRYFRRFG